MSTPVGTGRGCPLDDELDGKPRRADLVQQRSDPLQAGLRSKRNRLVAAKHAEQAAHLREPFPPGQLDPLERDASLLRLRGEHLLAGLCLYDHHAHRVRDCVMELAGDLSSLFGNGDTGPFLLLPVLRAGPAHAGRPRRADAS